MGMKKAAAFLLGLLLGVLLTSGPERKPEYTEADLYRVKEFILDLNTPTEAEIKKYDLDGNGDLGATDLLMIKKILICEEEKP
jgi:hypothetical protein